MNKLFGTDGIRRIYPDYLDRDLAYKVGKAVASIIEDDKVVILGRDTRKSGEILSRSLEKGLRSGGVKVRDLGIVPTPLIGYYSYKEKKIGVMITASHNPRNYNGIKIFDKGFKIEREVEDKIESFVSKISNDDREEISKDQVEDRERERKILEYIDHLVEGVREDFSSLNIAIDCANGGVSSTIKLLKDRLGLGKKTVIINDHMDRDDINVNCGSMHIEELQELVVARGYDGGFAFDGDGDRCVIVDDKGNYIDGDCILAMLANYYLDNNLFKKKKMNLGTEMSNLGLEEYCLRNNIKFKRAEVGDKNVIKEMIKNDCELGGEPVGHITFLNKEKSSDGELTMIEVLVMMVKTKKKLSELRKIMKKYSQVTRNILVTDREKNLFRENKEIKEYIANLNRELEGNKRIVVRVSGTEPYIRVMVEGEEGDRYLEEVCREIEKIRE